MIGDKLYWSLQPGDVGIGIPTDASDQN